MLLSVTRYVTNGNKPRYKNKKATVVEKKKSRSYLKAPAW